MGCCGGRRDRSTTRGRTHYRFFVQVGGEDVGGPFPTRRAARAEHAEGEIVGRRVDVS